MDFDTTFCKAVFLSDNGENIIGNATTLWMFLVFVATSLVHTLVALVNESVIATWVVV